MDLYTSRSATAVTSIIVALVAAVVGLYASHVVYAQESQVTYTFTTAYFGWTWSPAAHYWNPFAPINYIDWPAFVAMPLAAYDDPTGQWWPILASNWTAFPQNKTVIIYLRHNIYWFNGSAVMPFTAWDVYAELYIGVKAFSWYYPYLTPQNASEEIRVLNNYTLEIVFNIWSPTEYYWILMQTIATPWPVWKPIVEKLQTMNASQAYTFGQVNITEFNPPMWSNGPYYVASIGPTYITQNLDPMYFDGKPLLAEWDKILPFHTWQYYPTFIAWNNPGASTILAAIAAQKPVYIEWIAFSLLKDLQIINSTPGFKYYVMPDLSIFGIGIPTYYPFNIPQVRQAFLYIINRSEAAAAWGPPWLTYPVYINVPAPAPTAASGLWLTFPKDLRSIAVNFTEPNWTKAAQLLESAGLKYKNGQWYLPNGTPLTLTIYASAPMVNWITQAQVAFNQLEEFGIPVKLITLESSTYSTEVSQCQLPAVVDWMFAGSNKGGYSTLWISYDVAFTMTHPALLPSGWCIPGHTTPFAYPIVQNNEITGWYCKPLTTNLPIPNNTIIWCINSTYGYINLSNWQNAIIAAEPGSSTYEELLKAYFSWFEYWVPGVEISTATITAAFPVKITNPMWAYECMNFKNPKYTKAAYSLFHQYAVAGLPPEFNTVLSLGAYAPQGVIPPLAEAIINGSLWTNPYLHQYAVFIGLPNPDPQLQACVASYFHTTYTPVTTTTTSTVTSTTTAVSTVTSTVTTTAVSTVTSTATTTAISTVTVTKPVISTALIAGIVIIVVVIAIVAAIIALRRR
ncbi:ABC transporter substrate-binding protein [Caldivirga maquilingensis]|uniref:Extracellular solute-binding protein family 5 n=1 Tax=Caldivirga maquilingensis (strain ATCC 700844 / DSM 13496 / JCM 10307 / IC-167) TaxID=397948 RepID=A8ME95_CALMQ|nr:ABC transporter substrate-binding protein [Caldivirga maquilingensis]ABW02101.1 extracellular solute-binding protein family 5 [Caldivirga maquilingensis IC-167]